jgi:hypothetical protein
LGQGAISQSSQESSGVGAQFGASGYFRRHIGQQGRISLNWNAQTTQYEDNTYNSDVINLSLPYERVTPTGNWSIMPFYREAWYTTNADNYAAGLQFGLTRRISPRNALRFSYLYEDRRYEDLSFQNGSFTSASLSFNRQLTPSMGIEIGLSQQVSDPQVAHLQYTENGLTTALSNTWPGGLQSQFRLGYGIRDFVGDYPLTTSPREDDYYTLSVSLQHSRIDIRGFTPQLQCSHTVNNSNIAFSDYDVTECQITLSRNF